MTNSNSMITIKHDDLEIYRDVEI